MWSSMWSSGQVSARAHHHPQGVETQYVVTQQCGDQAAKGKSEGEGANPKVSKHPDVSIK